MGDVTVNVVGWTPKTITSNETTVPNGVGVNWGQRTRPPSITLPENASQRPRATARRNAPREWFRFENAADEETADVYIFDEISDPFLSEFFGIGISASGFIRELQALKGKAINVHINSPGGSVFEGLAIYNNLRQHDAPVNVIVDGIAASIASVIAMAGDTVTMAPHSMMMIHEPWGFTVGNAADHEQQVKVLNKIGEDIAAVYRERADKRVNWRAKMAEETWLTDEDALSLGLADRIDTAASSAQNRFDLSRFRNAPPDLAAAGDVDQTPTVREIEQVLRDAGLSTRQAKAVLATGWSALDARDDAESAAGDGEGAALDGDTADTATGTVAGFAEMEAARARLRLQELALAG